MDEIYKKETKIRNYTWVRAYTVCPTGHEAMKSHTYTCILIGVLCMRKVSMGGLFPFAILYVGQIVDRVRPTVFGTALGFQPSRPFLVRFGSWTWGYIWILKFSKCKMSVICNIIIISHFVVIFELVIITVIFDLLDFFIDIFCLKNCIQLLTFSQNQWEHYKNGPKIINRQKLVKVV